MIGIKNCGGGGVEVTIDGVAAEEEIKLTSKKTWYKESVLPYVFYSSRAVALNDEAHLLGFSASTTTESYHYKYDGSEWTKLPDYAPNATAAVAFNGEIHAFGYSKSTSDSKYHRKLVGTSWTSVSTLPYNFYSAPAVVYNNEIHLLGFEGSTDTQRKYHYKWSGSSWTQVSTIPFYSYGTMAVVYDGELHLMGGGSYGNKYHYKWNGTTWTNVGELPYSPSSFGCAVVYENKIHILGYYDGSNSGRKNAHWSYDGSTWSEDVRIPNNFVSGAAIVLSNGINIFGCSSSSDYPENEQHLVYSTIYTKEE